MTVKLKFMFKIQCKISYNIDEPNGQCFVNVWCSSEQLVIQTTNKKIYTVF